jgi:penicillin-binding protein 1B
VGATPAVALGAYQETPLELARAYTVFANEGVRVQPTFLSEINDRNGVLLYHHTPQTKRVLDPRVAFLMVDMLQEVMRSGTAAGARSRGFRLPAAGKTGTSHDGWFAGFYLAALMLGVGGFRRLQRTGAGGRAFHASHLDRIHDGSARYKQYRSVKPFTPPAGLVNVGVDLASGQACPGGAMSYFIAGTEPTSECAPQEIEVNFTPEGGTQQRIVPVAAVVDRPPTQN